MVSTENFVFLELHLLKRKNLILQAWCLLVDTRLSRSTNQKTKLLHKASLSQAKFGFEQNLLYGKPDA
jgi:hypothetical protein